MTTRTLTTVRCRCGDVALHIGAPPIAQFYCHCEDCRAVTGGAMVPTALYPADGVALEGGETRGWTYKTMPRTRCANCATLLFGEPPGLGVRGVNGFLLPAGAFRPAFHIRCQHAVMPVVDDLPHYRDVPSMFGGSDETVDWPMAERGGSSRPSDVFAALVNGVAEGRWEDLPQLYAQQTHVEHPFHPLRMPPMRTREELREHFRQAARGPELRRQVTNVVIHETGDPEVIVAEFTYDGTLADTGEAFSLPGIFVMRVRDGEIVSSRDYLDHLTSARIRGQFGDLLAALDSKQDLPSSS